mmetsp:Transcript_38454/g.69948  ORF Transcript_38454/g.69948 Transcript_38454/m.69948 type:complete len:99 (-) Transcript_38454:24-320(-)
MWTKACTTGVKEWVVSATAVGGDATGGDATVMGKSKLHVAAMLCPYVRALPKEFDLTFMDIVLPASSGTSWRRLFGETEFPGACRGGEDSHDDRRAAM